MEYLGNTGRREGGEKERVEKEGTRLECSAKVNKWNCQWDGKGKEKESCGPSREGRLPCEHQRATPQHPQLR